MYLGEIVELGSRSQVFENPQHPYTKKLMAAVPIPDPRKRRQDFSLITGEVPSPVHGLDYQPELADLQQIAAHHFVAKSAMETAAIEPFGKRQLSMATPHLRFPNPVIAGHSYHVAFDDSVGVLDSRNWTVNVEVAPSDKSLPRISAALAPIICKFDFRPLQRVSFSNARPDVSAPHTRSAGSALSPASARGFVSGTVKVA